MSGRVLTIVEHYSLESPVATEFRRLLHNLTAAKSDGEVKTLLVTSATTGEGKSTACSLLALTAAAKQTRTLLIDCDLRRPSIHRLFGLDREVGVVDVLAHGTEVKSVIKKTGLDHLDIVTAGQPWPQPAELFDSRLVATMIEDLKYYYDLVIVDAPPVIPVSDPMLLAPWMDGVLLVVKAGHTAREVAKRAVDIMASNNARVLGVMLNNAEGSLPHYYDYTHYSYDYQPHDVGQAKKKPSSAGRRKTSHTKPPKRDGAGHQRKFAR